MFRARGTRVLFFDAPEPQPEVVTPPVVENYTPADDELAAALGMPPALPAMTPEFADDVRAAMAGDLGAIKRMRTIGDSIPEGMQVAFAEMVEQLLSQ